MTLRTNIQVRTPPIAGQDQRHGIQTPIGSWISVFDI